MRSLFALVTLVVLASGCSLYFNDDHGDDDDVCPLAEPATGPTILLRNPVTLRCENLGGGCDPLCGPCPTIARQPIPSWGECGSPCDQLGEAACAADARCRILKIAGCAIQGNCLTDFMGCVATDTNTDLTVDCRTADPWDCSRSNQCTALHSGYECPALSDSVECPRPFELCIREGANPGRCGGEVTCRAVAPDCPTGTTPGIRNGCYTGACIPLHLCSS